MGDRSNYGIFVENSILKDLSNAKNVECLQIQRTALLGTIVKIESVLGNNYVAVKFLKEGETWDSNLFHCPRDNVVFLDDKIWPFLAAVPSPQERVKLAKNKKKYEKILQLTKEMVVSFTEYKDVQLGTIKYIGNVKGMGKCFGIQLHQKKEKGKCNGSFAGIQYFHCLPGYGAFVTIDKIIPQSTLALNDDDLMTSDFDKYLEHNITSLTGTLSNKSNNKNHVHLNSDETDRIENTQIPILNQIKSVPVKSSHSLQSINEQINPNNDFDQNTIIQPEHIQLIKQQNKLKNTQTKSTAQFYTSEVDLIDTIGRKWHGSSDQEQLEKFSQFDIIPEKINKNEVKADKLSKNTFTYIINNGKNLPKKKLNEDRVANFTTYTEKCFVTPEPGTTNDLSVGSLVEIINDDTEDPLYGVIRWMGLDTEINSILVGVELEDDHENLSLTLTDGTYDGVRYFECPNKKGVFVHITQCRKDSRFQDGTPTPVHAITEKMFGKMDCPVVEGFVAPLCLPTEEDVDAVCGKFRGIQGHHNSCYLDATLFSMFTYTGVFDSLLYRPKGPNDIPEYTEVQKVLREEIVNPLRTSLFVRADRVMTLRKLLDRLSSVSGLMSEEKDPEEFLNSLLAQILKAEPFLKLSSGQESYFYQLFIEKNEQLKLPSVQQLFEQSFFTSDIKLKEVPSCLIIQMPRFGKSYKMYPRILPSQLLDVTDIIENSPRQCTVCGKLASWECRQCFSEGEGMSLESTTFCNKCLEVVHTHSKRLNHQPRQLHISQDFSIMAEHCPPPRLYMELFAVVCIETSHYVTFVKCGVGHEAPWCFFDSMADRKGERDGYNIPEMVACPDVSKWLSDEALCRSMHENAPHDRLLPEHARRLLCDAYICMYQSPDVLMYR